MNLIYINGDRGIPARGEKGGAVHIREMLSAFRALGCAATLIAARLGKGEHLPCPAEEVSIPALDAKPKGAERAAALIANSEALADKAVSLGRAQPVDFLYERYSLWSTAGLHAARALGAPLILEVNAPLVGEQAQYRNLALPDEARRIEAENFAGVDVLVAVSEEVRDYAVSRGAPPERAIVLGNAVDPDRFHPGAAPAEGVVPPDAFVVGFAGGLKPWHGLEPLLEAFHILRAEDGRAHLLLVGDGPMRGWVEDFVNAHDLGDAVTLTGWVAHDRLPSLIAAMSVATAPYPEIDGFYFSPLKLFEYMAVGRPVVASRVGRMHEAAPDGEAALLVPPSDAKALAGALLRISRDPALAMRLAEGAARAGAGRTWAANARAAVAHAGLALS